MSDIIQCPVCACKCEPCQISMKNLTFIDSQDKSEILSSLLLADIPQASDSFEKGSIECVSDSYIYYGKRKIYRVLWCASIRTI
jgi:hypothetical protein